ncbi:MAG: cold shock domain-containing protein [Magnetococcus sp. DMHC-6]
MKKTEKTILFAKIFNVTQYQKNHPEIEWIEIFRHFILLAIESFQGHGVQFVRPFGWQIMASFALPESAIQAAITLQDRIQAEKEASSEQGVVSCKVGIATGVVYESDLGQGLTDLFGFTVEVARQLCDLARGNAIIVQRDGIEYITEADIQSVAGKKCRRSTRDYFLEEPPRRLEAIAKPIEIYSIFWQAHCPEYLARTSMEAPGESDQDGQSEKMVYFGKVSAFKEERGFGFIQYYNENNEYKEIYFHMTYVLTQPPIHEHDDVQFVIKPGKGGRPQACSVLVMGGRLQGQVESIDPFIGGFISIRNNDSELLKFYMIPQEIHGKYISINDIVEFTVNSGSDMEGLTASQVIPFEGETPSSHVGSGDNLVIGSLENAVITAYFSEKGYGFAKCRRNNIYLHVSEFIEPEITPLPGDTIEFEVLPGRNGTYRASGIRFTQRKNAAFPSLPQFDY